MRNPVFGEHKMLIASEAYSEIKARDIPMMVEDHMMPVDLYGAFAPQEKGGAKSLETMSQNIKDRFGLNSI